jgi:hypothetical protein
MAIMGSSAEIGIYIKKLQVWTSDTQHIDTILVMSVNEVWLILFCRDNSDMTPIQTASCGRETCKFIKLARQFCAVSWPFDDVILQVNKTVGHSVDHSANSWRGWTFHISEDVIQASCSEEV